MADIRINALTEASASVTTDFLPIDGSTGTRKLSAYNPSFGGNATVGGTLSTVGNATVGTSGNAVLTLGTSGAAYTHYIYGATAGGAIQIKSDPATTDRHLSLGSINNSYVYTEMLKLANTGVVTIPGTTGSTTTSSGALVVGNGTSGGLGVGGAITAGGTLRVIGSSQIIRVRHDASNIEFTNTAQDAYVTGTVIGNTLQLHGNNGTGLTIGSTGNATFAGNITTGAPSGGTAAAWKLGTVATVSPTSPNRTIEVDIGGTIYYIHAKTTNN